MDRDKFLTIQLGECWHEIDYRTNKCMNCNILARIDEESYRTKRTP